MFSGVHLGCDPEGWLVYWFGCPGKSVDHNSCVDYVGDEGEEAAGKGGWLVAVMGPAGRLVDDYPDHQGTYCVGQDGPLQGGSHSSDDTENV